MNCKTAMTLMMLSGIASTSWGDVVIHENEGPGYEISEFGGCTFTGCYDGFALDITRGADDQDGFTTAPNYPPHTFVFNRPDPSFGHVHLYSLEGGINTAVAGVQHFIDVPGLAEGSWDPVTPEVVGVDDVIDASFAFNQRICNFLVGPQFGAAVHLLPLEAGGSNMVAVTVELDDGVHYGFIEFESNGQENILGSGYPRLRPLSWGWESTPETPFVFPQEACGLADLELDGELNFFDVSAFLSAFTSMDSAADFNNDGNFNFFDVSAFLSAFNAGCP